MTLTGTRIVLRPYEPEDLPLIHAWKNDPETTRWLGRRFRRTFTLDDSRDSLQKAIEESGDTTLFFAIARKDSLAYLGGIDLTDIDSIDRNAVLSMVIGHPEDRNQGYASEAIQLLLAHAFGTLRLHKVSLTVIGSNQAALRCYRKNGFREEGRLRDHRFIDGVYHDSIQMGLLAPEWRQPC